MMSLYIHSNIITYEHLMNCQLVLIKLHTIIMIPDYHSQHTYVVCTTLIINIYDYHGGVVNCPCHIAQ